MEKLTVRKLPTLYNSRNMSLIFRTHVKRTFHTLLQSPYICLCLCAYNHTTHTHTAGEFDFKTVASEYLGFLEPQNNSPMGTFT